MTRIHKPKRRIKRDTRGAKPCTSKHWNTGAIAWCAGRTRLDLQVVDDAMVALTTFDGRLSVSDRELAQHLINAIGLDQMASYRLVRALRLYYDVQLEAYVELLHDHEPDGVS